MTPSIAFAASWGLDASQNALNAASISAGVAANGDQRGDQNDEETHSALDDLRHDSIILSRCE